MKFVKKVFFASILIVLLIQFKNIIPEISSANNTGQYIITGQITDENNNPQKDVDIKIINAEDNNNIFTSKTNQNGQYFATVPKGKYYIEFKYNNQCDTIDMEYTTYDLYDKNLELAFVYTTNNEQQVEEFNNKLVEDNKEFRLIKNKYINKSDIGEKILLLQVDSTSENAFHNIWYEGYKGITVILTQEEENKVMKLVENCSLSSDYNVIVLKQSESTIDILKKIYEKLKIKEKKHNEPILDSSNISDDSAKTTTIDINSTSIINVKVKNGTSGGKISGDSNYPDFITGNITVPKANNFKAVVKLKDKAGNEKARYISTDGKYHFNYPGTGNYKIEFEFENQNNINAQYYENDNYGGDITCGGRTENCISKTNNQQVNQKYTEIKYIQEEQLDNGAECGLIAETKSFEICDYPKQISPGIYEYDLNDKKIVANAKLKEREKFSLTVDENVNEYKIVLSNGQIFKQYKDGQNDEAKNMRLHSVAISNKLSYGAKLYVEYKITVTNNSNIDCSGLTILNRIYNLDYDENQKLLKDSRTNKKIGWNKVNINNIGGNLIKEEKKVNSMPTSYLSINLGRVKAKERKDLYLILTRTLDANSKDENSIFDNNSELVIYKNSQGRRNYNTINMNLSSVTEGVTKSGNYTYGNDETDNKEAEEIAVLPPTGNNLNILITIILIIILILICKSVGVRFIYKKQGGNKNGKSKKK